MIIIQLDKLFLQNYLITDGSPMSYGDFIQFYFEPHLWAPGVIAGCEGFEFIFGHDKYKITEIDMENRAVNAEKIS